MAVREVYRSSSTKVILVGSKLDIRRSIRKFYTSAGWMLAGMFVAALVSPVIWVMLASWLVFRHSRIWSEHFADDVFPTPSR